MIYYENIMDITLKKNCLKEKRKKKKEKRKTLKHANSIKIINYN